MKKTLLLLVAVMMVGLVACRKQSEENTAAPDYAKMAKEFVAQIKETMKTDDYEKADRIAGEFNDEVGLDYYEFCRCLKKELEKPSNKGVSEFLALADISEYKNLDNLALRIIDTKKADAKKQLKEELSK